MTTVFVAMPYYDKIEPEAHEAFAMHPPADFEIEPVKFPSSLLAHTFNVLWCEALNRRAKTPIDYFVMLHADIYPQADWVQRLVDEIRATGADIVSAVVPIKNDGGVTSTAIDSIDDPFEVHRRLTMKEIMRLPETFDAAACGFPDRRLCVNTGCWIADFRKPWVEDAVFQIRNAIVRGPDGLFKPKVFSEDWELSRFVAGRGGKVLATRKVKLEHIGRAGYRNYEPWGKDEMDHMANGEPLPVFQA